MIKIGIAGARGLSCMAGFNALENVSVTALCDLNGELLAEQSAKHSIPHTYRVFEDMLMSDIDAVVIATPMQCHVPQALKALEAGKHVMSEVTAGVTMDELWWLTEAVESSGRIYMFAENYCYTPEAQLIRALSHAGKFGDVYYGEGEYLHNVRSLTQYPDGSTSWRKYWQLGKRGAFYPTHSLGPVMQWFEGDHVARISAFSSGQHDCGDLRQDDTTVVMCQLESGKLVRIRVDCMSNRPHNMVGYQLQGTKGCYESARSPFAQPVIYLGDDPDKAKWQPLSDFDEYLPERYRLATEEQRSAGHHGGDFFIVEDFVNAIETGVQPELDVYKACEWTAVGLLSELSVTNGGRGIDVPRFRKDTPRAEQIIKL